MLGTTHQRIAQNICNELGITDKRKIGLLLGGSTHPDKWMNFPHHFGKDKEIYLSIRQARDLFLQEDDESYHFLGIALHYIADRWTLRPRLSDKHTEWEKEIENNSIVEDSKLKQAISDASLPTKTVEALVNFMIELSKGPAILEGQEAPYAMKVFQFSTQNRPSFVSPISNEMTTWSTPMIDLNFAYRICLVVSKAVTALPPCYDSEFYSKALQLQKKLLCFPESFIEKNWTYKKLDELANKEKMIEYMHGSVGQKAPRPQELLWLKEHDYFRIEEINVPMKALRKVKVLKTQGLLRKKEIEKEEIIEEIVEKTIFRLHLYPLRQMRIPRALIQGYIDFQSKLAARYALDKLNWIVNNPNCSERQIARTPMQGDYGVGSADPDGNSPWIRWYNFISMEIPEQNHLETLYKTYESDKARLDEIKNNPETWI